MPRKSQRSRRSSPSFRVVPNAAVSRVLREIADGLEIEGENPFRVRAYRNAAQSLENLSEPVAEVAARGGREALVALPGVGESIAAKILEMLETGKLAQLEEVRKEIPEELSRLLKVTGLGPKKLHLLHEELGVSDVDDLERALHDGSALRLPGFGERSVEKLLRAVGQFRARQKGRFRLSEAEPYAEALVAYLEKVRGVGRVAVAGSFRRRKETVGDLDVLCTASNGKSVMEAFAGFDPVEEVLLSGPTKTSVRLANGLQVDLRVVEEVAFGAALHYFTGSKEHNIALRGLAREKGYKVSEYGVFRGKRRVGGRTEDEVFAVIGAGFIPPELRENGGEIEAARAGRLPELVELGDLRGDLQMHTTASDGRASPGEMARAARDLGYDYIAVTDHSQAVTVAGGLDDAEILEHRDRLRKLRVPGLRVLAGVEVDVLKDGSLDLAPETLERLDLVVASVHSYFDLPRGEMTRRVLRAVESGLVDVLGHPTGRLIDVREPIEMDLEAVIEACVRNGVAIEINAQPDRLDLSDTDARLARDRGAKLVISTDAHTPDNLKFMRYGVGVARRAWLTRDDVLNTLPVEALLAWFGRRRLAA